MYECFLLQQIVIIAVLLKICTPFMHILFLSFFSTDAVALTKAIKVKNIDDLVLFCFVLYNIF